MRHIAAGAPVDAHTGFTLWLTGLSGAGKSTIAAQLAKRLRQCHRSVEVLDGDEIRKTLSRDLRFSRQDRLTNIERIGFIARLLSRNGVAVIVAAVSPYRSGRSNVRRRHEAPFVEVFVDCALEELVRRDTKGLYRRAARGALKRLSGVSDPYEPPARPDVHIHTDRESISASVALLVDELKRRRLM